MPKMTSQCVDFILFPDKVVFLKQSLNKHLLTNFWDLSTRLATEDFKEMSLSLHSYAYALPMNTWPTCEAS